MLVEAFEELTAHGIAHDLVIATASKPKKWIQKVAKTMEKRGTAGALHRYFDIPEGETIPVKLMREALEDESTSEKTRKRIQFALNMRKIARKAKKA